MMQLWLADVLRQAGLPVRELPGWKTRGHGEMGQIFGVLAHHTAGPRTGNYPSEGVVVSGRPDLAGPLANLGLARDGTWIVVAAGQAWHAGSGSISWCPKDTGNTHLLGVEGESCGVVDDWTDAQRGSYPRGAAALLSHLGLPASRAIGHKEWAPTRKIDPAFWDMSVFRADVARWQATASKPPPAPVPPRPLREDDDMYVKTESVPKGPIWTGLLSGGVLIGPLSPGETSAADSNIKSGAVLQWLERSTWDQLANRIKS